jgi:hypothetical protein
MNKIIIDNTDLSVATLSHLCQYFAPPTTSINPYCFCFLIMPYTSNNDCDNQYANIPSQNWATDLTMPPLPPPLPRSAKPKSLIPRPPTLPPNAFRSISNSAFLQVMTAANAFNKQDYTESPFRPCHLFFYSSLVDPLFYSFTNFISPTSYILITNSFISLLSSSTTTVIRSVI